MSHNKLLREKKGTKNKQKDTGMTDSAASPSLSSSSPSSPPEARRNSFAVPATPLSPATPSASRRRGKRILLETFYNLSPSSSTSTVCPLSPSLSRSFFKHHPQLIPTPFQNNNNNNINNTGK